MIDEHTNKGLALAAGIKGMEIDSFDEIIGALNIINTFEPRKEWILKLLNSNEAIDFKIQILMVIEDYAKTLQI